MMTERAKRIAKGAAGAIAALAVLLFANTAGWLRPVTDTGFGACTLLKDRTGGPAGPEDMALDPQTGLAYVGGANRTGGTPGGGIYVIDTRATAPIPERLDSLDPASFAPHGIDLYLSPDGRKRLFVINHGASGTDHSVEIFDVLNDGSIHHLETVKSDLFTSPNDVAAIGPRSFYVSNDPFGQSPLRRIAETYLMLPLGNVVYFNAIGTRVAADGLTFANGLLADTQAGKLYIAQSVGRSVRRYAIAPDGQLQQDASIGVPMAADNLSRSESGTIIVTGHPRPLAFNSHAASPATRKSPTMVMELTPDLEAKTLVYETSDAVSGGSIALKDATRLFIGSVFGPGILFCNKGPRF